jgi:hypothetical protein
MNNINDFALEIEYNAKLAEYREWDNIQKKRLDPDEIDYLLAKGYTLTVECDNVLKQIRDRGLVTHSQVVKGFDIEPQQLSLAS